MIQLGAIAAEPWFKDWIAPLILTVLTGSVARYMNPSARVIWATLHGFSFLLHRTVRPDDPNQNTTFLVHTQTILVQNTGRASAESVEVYFAFKPENLVLWPAINYSERVNPDGHYVLTLERLVPREQVRIELIQGGNRELPTLIRVRTATHMAKEKPMMWQQVFPKSFNVTVLALLLMGTFLAAKWLVALVAWVTTL